MRVIRSFFLFLACLANMILPVDAMPDRNIDEDIAPIHDADTEGYQFNYVFSGPGVATLKLAVNRPDGSPVTDAQVVMALIDQQGRHYLTRAVTDADGYRVDTASVGNDLSRIEAEVVTGGRLLTDHFQLG